MKTLGTYGYMSPIEKVKSFKVTEEMKDPNFNFTGYVYEKTNCSSVNEDSLLFFDKQRNLTTNVDNAAYFLMIVKENINETNKL